MKDLLKILLRQWTFYITLVLFVVLYFVPDGDISSKTAMCYIGLMQVFLIVFWLLRAVFMKRLPCERQDAFRLRRSTTCANGFFNNIFGMALAGGLLGVAAALLQLS